MAKREDLQGKRFGLLVVLEVAKAENGQVRWHCLCDCGNTCDVLAANLKNGHTKSCGCIKSPDIVGKKYGKLTVIGRSNKRQPRGNRTTPLWECRCECGAITYKAKDTLTNPDTSMCAKCAGKSSAENARRYAGFADGTQITKIKDMTPNAANTSGCRGVFFEKSTNKWRARIKFKGKSISLGSYKDFGDAANARKKAEQIYFAEFLENYKKQTEKA